MNSKLIFVLIISIKLCISAPVKTDSSVQSTLTDEEIASSIEEIQKKFSSNENSIKKLNEKVESSEKRRIDLDDPEDDDDNYVTVQPKKPDELDSMRHTKAFPLPISSSVLKPEASFRRDKMLGYFGYYPQPIQPVPTPFYPSPDYFEDYPAMETPEEIFSRANRRRPQNSISPYENSPIYYIRLPPTPYMFVPGLGYISQPPSIQPMNALAPVPQIPPPISPMSSLSPMSQYGGHGFNPFINLPLNFVSNGKPTNIYQWSGANRFQPNLQYNPMGYPQRPHRPSFKPKPFLQDSKVTHLKGQYLFNGRPEEIYLLPQTPYHNSQLGQSFNSINSIYSDPMQHHYF